MLKEFIKKYNINIILGIITTLLLVPCFMNGVFFENMIHFIIFCIMFGSTFCYQKMQKDEAGKVKKYNTLNLFKKILTIVLLVIGLIFLALIPGATGWDGLGYLIFAGFAIFFLIVIHIVNMFFRIYYLIRYKQKLEIKAFFKANKWFFILNVFLLIFYIFTCFFIGS